jgi:transcription elongation factor Elf1
MAKRGRKKMETKIEQQGSNRMTQYRKNPPCPKCDHDETSCVMRDEGYALFRCRLCGHRWEVKSK